MRAQRSTEMVTKTAIPYRVPFPTIPMPAETDSSDLLIGDGRDGKLSEIHEESRCGEPRCIRRNVTPSIPG